MSENDHVAQVRDEWGDLKPSFIVDLLTALDAQDLKTVRAMTRELHAADMADVLQAIEQYRRVELISVLGKNFDVEALAELDEGTRDAILDDLPADVIASAIKKLDTDDALYLIEDMERHEQVEILSKVPKEDRAALSRGLDFPENTAGRLMQTEYVAVPYSWNVGKALEHVRTAKEIPESFVEIYAIDDSGRLEGAVPLSRLLRGHRDKRILDIMDKKQTVFSVTDPQEDVAYKFEQYNLVSAAVTDSTGCLVGMLMVDDILDVIQEEADVAIKRLGGVGSEEEIEGSVVQTTRLRFAWLFVNLLTAVLASWVISWFDATIQQMVAIAVLMPIVASMGGNAGTQTMTVAVRALATRELGPVNAVRVVFRECAVGLINGLLFAIIIGLFVWWWFGFGGLGLVIGIAMIINLVAAALAGILLPLALDYFDTDPAVSAAVFLTTVTDVVGFFSFLGLATLFLKLGLLKT
ncbi:MAG: magnesium transporter [Alphaproteobacteria bacterium]|nr:magnesium transporter [Alphaproteobacteria bacterium]